MATPKKQDSRFSSAIETGPMRTRGDLSASKEPLSPKARNCFTRRGRVRIRDPFTQVGSEFTSTNGAFGIRDMFVWEQRSTSTQNQASAARILIGNGRAYSGFVRGEGFYSNTAGASLTAFSNIYRINSVAEHEGTAYISTSPGSSETLSLGEIYSFDGSTETATPFATKMFSRLLSSFGGRVIAAGCRFDKTASATGLNFKIDHDVGASWTVGGTGATQPVKTGTDVVWTINHATDNYIEYTAASSVAYTATYTGWHTIAHWLKPVEPESSVYLKFEVRDSAAGTVLYTKDYTLVNTTADPEWQVVLIPVQLTNTQTITVRIWGGNGSKSATVGDQVQLSINHGNSYGDMYGLNVYQGTFGLDEPLSRVQTPPSGYAGEWITRDNFVYWSDPLTPDEWIASNYITLDDMAGDFTSINVVNGKIVITRKNAIYVLRPVPGEQGVDQAFVFENAYHSPGPVSQKATTVYKNVMFYIGEDNVYAFTGDGEPEEVLDDNIKDSMFPLAQATGTTAETTGRCVSIAVDSLNDELYIISDKTQTKLWVYSLEDKAMSGYIEAPDFTGANNEPPLGGGASANSVFWDVAWAYNKLYVIVGDYWIAADINYGAFFGYFDRNATQDTIDGNTNYLWAEYQFKPQESDPPRSTVTIQRFGIKHSITGDQTNASVKFRISTDFGANWKYAQVRLTRLATAALPGSTRTSRYFIHKTGQKFLFSVVYNGPGGEAYFNLESGVIDGLLRGRENQTPHDTKLGTGTE